MVEMLDIYASTMLIVRVGLLHILFMVTKSVRVVVQIIIIIAEIKNRILVVMRIPNGLTY